jgi:hypothetical protein
MKNFIAAFAAFAVVTGCANQPHSNQRIGMTPQDATERVMRPKYDALFALQKTGKISANEFQARKAILDDQWNKVHTRNLGAAAQRHRSERPIYVFAPRQQQYVPYQQPYQPQWRGMAPAPNQMPTNYRVQPNPLGGFDVTPQQGYLGITPQAPIYY